MGRFTVQELIYYLSDCDPKHEVRLRIEGHDFSILDVLQDWRGATYLLGLEAGK